MSRKAGVEADNVAAPMSCRSGFRPATKHQGKPRRRKRVNLNDGKSRNGKSRPDGGGTQGLPCRSRNTSENVISKKPPSRRLAAIKRHDPGTALSFKNTPRPGCITIFAWKWMASLNHGPSPKAFRSSKGEKRLAVQVEDHPVSYFDFEGTIPKGQYGGGTVMVWDQGTFETAIGGLPPVAGIESGQTAFSRWIGKKLKGEWHLVRLRNGSTQWLLIKGGDADLKPVSKKSDDTSALSGKSMAQLSANGRGLGIEAAHAGKFLQDSAKIAVAKARRSKKPVRETQKPVKRVHRADESAPAEWLAARFG